MLDAEFCAEPGPWRNSLTPYLVEIMDAFGDRRVRDLVLMGGTQWGKTECLINCLLWLCTQWQRPTLMVMPAEDEALAFAGGRLRAAMEHCAEVRELLPPDLLRSWKVTSNTIPLSGMKVRLAWARSPSKLASNSVGCVLFDEVDKYPAFSGKEADPISLGTERMRWWLDSKRVRASTPTTEHGYIWRAWKTSDQRWFHVACPHCGHYQPLRFSYDTVKWPEGERDPEKIRRERLATYICRSCKRPIEDSDQTRRRMLADGVWCPTGGEVTPAREVVDVDTTSDCRGYHLNALYSPRITWSEVAAKWLDSRRDLAKRMNFQNSWNGWPWVETQAESTAEQLKARATAIPRRVVPDGTIALTAGVDVQEHEAYVEVTAHLPLEREHTIEAFRVESLADVHRMLVDGVWHGAKGEEWRVSLGLVDSGYRTDEVYRLCLEAPHVLRPCKGHQQRPVPFSAVKIERDWLGQAGGLQLWHVDTTYYKNRWTRLHVNEIGTRASWTCYAEPDSGWLAQLCAEHKVLERKGGKVLPVWKPKPDGGPNHWFDCRVYNQAAADMLGLYAALAEEPVEDKAAVPEDPTLPARVRDAAERASGLGRARGGWISKLGR